MNARDRAQLAANQVSNNRASRLGYNTGLRGEPKVNPYPRALDGSGMANECFWEDAYRRGHKRAMQALTCAPSRA